MIRQILNILNKIKNFVKKAIKLILIGVTSFLVIAISIFLIGGLLTSNDSLIKENDSLIKEMVRYSYQSVVNKIGDKLILDYLTNNEEISTLLAGDLQVKMDDWTKSNSPTFKGDDFRWAINEINKYPANYSEIIKNIKPEKISYKLGIRKAREIKTSDIYKNNKSSVVVVALVDDKGEVGYGSGFVVSPDGIVATNYHVIEADFVEDGKESNYKIGIGFPENKKVFPIKSILAVDKEKDLALLKVDSKNINFPVVTIADQVLPEIGSEIITIGSPLYMTNTVLNGIVSSVRFNEASKINEVQISVPTDRGNSGGPVFNQAGQVIAVYYASSNVLPGIHNFNFAIPISYLREMMDEVNKRSIIIKK